MYNVIIKGIADQKNNIRRNIENIMNVYLNLFLEKEKFENFNENILIFDTKRKLDINVVTINIYIFLDK